MHVKIQVLNGRKIHVILHYCRYFLNRGQLSSSSLVPFDAPSPPLLCEQRNKARRPCHDHHVPSCAWTHENRRRYEASHSWAGIMNNLFVQSRRDCAKKMIAFSTPSNVMKGLSLSLPSVVPPCAGDQTCFLRAPILRIPTLHCTVLITLSEGVQRFLFCTNPL